MVVKSSQMKEPFFVLLVSQHSTFTKKQNCSIVIEIKSSTICFVVMFYQSTRGGERGLSFEHVLLSSYSSDGGLYVPEFLPVLTKFDLENLAAQPISDVLRFVCVVGCSRPTIHHKT